ncbi:MAG: dockerin, partial [Cyanobacteriota bacterium]|nr:dockerin [Cyanobacteriota bacterium]
SVRQHQVLQPERLDLQLLVCKIKSTFFSDVNQDGQISVGDHVTYAFNVSEDAACTQSQSTFYGVEQIVARQALGHDRQQTFVTHFQGTFRLKKGNLQLRGLGSLGLSASKWKAINQSGSIDLVLANIFPESDRLSVFGEGGSYTGLVGTAFVKPGDAVVVDINLFSQFKLD